ncbi:glycosyltransferase family 2 protein [Paenibacillus sacheonensis]|uniref:Glycosyltransferase n=1 Tax=Paenibacillus sacheonensis TaxID=742054 RepID=A0A7X4YN33_9BACL|nr:glycosyltransferase family 2 protein [Paenibacillus sacheonensis]MBM7564877.1 glycosyltransferase involved in cell wall biosynthesis [Paenibacillus sacheonensis]NBC69425.1 glycosyltransferase [Paenibacillus sacheonensis]
MIVKNEAHTLAKCLDSAASLVDEIVIVDTGSTDRTKAIARQYTRRIYDFSWIDDFAAARNVSFSHARMDYILWLDADDQLSADAQDKLRHIKRTLPGEVDSVAMDYHLSFDRWGNPTASCRRNRLVKRSNRDLWIGAVHEYLELGPHARILISDIAISHVKNKPLTDRNLLIYNQLIDRGVALPPRDMLLYGNELLLNGHYEQAVEYYLRLLDDERALPEEKISACGQLALCAHYRGDLKSQMRYLLRSFAHGLPNAETCCRIGNLFFDEQRWELAAYWFMTALGLEKPVHAWGIVCPPYATWIPHLQLAICMGKLGMIERAYGHNEQARAYLPEDSAILHNKRLLEGLLQPRHLSP